MRFTKTVKHRIEGKGRQSIRIEDKHQAHPVLWWNSAELLLDGFGHQIAKGLGRDILLRKVSNQREFAPKASLDNSPNHLEAQRLEPRVHAFCHAIVDPSTLCRRSPFHGRLIQNLY